MSFKYEEKTLRTPNRTLLGRFIPNFFKPLISALNLNNVAPLKCTFFKTLHTIHDWKIYLQEASVTSLFNLSTANERVGLMSLMWWATL